MYKSMSQLTLSAHRLIRVRRLHTKEECHDSRSVGPKRHDHLRQIQSHRVLRTEESINASRLVSSRRAMSITLRRTTHCEKEAALGTIRSRGFVHRLSSQRSFRFQHSCSWDRHHWLSHHSREPSRLVCAEADRRRDSYGWHILSVEDLRFSWRDGQVREGFGGADGCHDASDEQRNRD